MNVLMLGDVVSQIGCDFLRQKLPAYKRFAGVDLCVCNAENSAKGNGVTPQSAEFLLSSGVDCLTTGNHAFRRRECYDFFDENPFIVRPCNYPAGAPGRGVCVIDLGRVRVGVVNLMGTMFLEPLGNPFDAAEEALRALSDCRVVLVDFHAEATSEKKAMGFFLDGRVSAVCGTHTHVQTSDETVLPGGTGYITDLGMCGAVDSVLGVQKEIVIEKFRTALPARFDIAEAGPCALEGCLFDIDETTGRCRSAQRLRLT
ncbi:MAG: TIGR00282 family metallophosphoesterase [Clostridia bacterium]|nr:TIGR00282 family metallophosphoesterase [Clostridia bacterium]